MNSSAAPSSRASMSVAPSPTMTTLSTPNASCSAPQHNGRGEKLGERLHRRLHATGVPRVACSRCSTAFLLAPVLHVTTDQSELVPWHTVHALPGLQVTAPVLLPITHGAKQHHYLLAPALLPITHGI